MRTYSRNQHSFFDDLVSYLSSVASFGMAIEAHNFGFRPAFRPNERIGLMGTPGVSNTELAFSPHSILQSIAANGWPKLIEFEEKPLNITPNTFSGFPIQLTGVKGLHSLMLQAMFIHYYETVRPRVEALYSADVRKWPSVLNFARVIRNAFAHGGQISFLNPDAQPASWRTLTYTPSDNGRYILYLDITAVEAILLMEDMDSTL